MSGKINENIFLVKKTYQTFILVKMLVCTYEYKINKNIFSSQKNL